MRYLAININYELDQDWYCRCTSVVDCYSYFDRLGPGHGPMVAIYDIEKEKYLWIAADHKQADGRLDRIVHGAVKKLKEHS